MKEPSRRRHTQADARRPAVVDFIEYGYRECSVVCVLDGTTYDTAYLNNTVQLEGDRSRDRVRV